MNGQMSIFDFPEYLPTKDFDSMTEEDVFKQIESTFSVKLTRNGSEATFKLDGVLYTCGPFSHYFEGVRDGRRFFHMDAQRGHGSSGSPSESMEEIIDFIRKKRTFKKENVCKFSNHECNKDDLWNVAKDLDNNFCPHVCCRFCSDFLCGARCNGAENVGRKIDQDGWHDISDEPQEGQFCKFEYLWTRHQKEDSKGHCTGWWTNGNVKWLNMPCDIGRKRVIRWTEAEEPKEKKDVDIRGLCDDGYCPDCGVRLNDLEEECSECGCLLDWTRWKSINEVE